MSNELQFSLLSLELTKELSLKSKKDNGIYFTPKLIIKKTIDIIKNISDYTDTIKFKTILEPSCGSCEFIKYITQEFPDKNLNITAIEFNDIIYQKIYKLNFIENTNNTIEFINKDYMTYDNNNEKMYDLIIGNPPYFVMNKDDVNSNSNLKEYSNFYDGRPNIFILFIIHSLKKLNINGVLAFILPKSFINCLYYNKLRKHIYENYKIIDIIDCFNDDCNIYLETKQETIIFVIQKINQLELELELKESNKKYISVIKDYVIFNTIENIKLINKLYENSTTLDDLGFDVKIGNIVWNQHKDKLTNDESKTLLIYSSNIKNNKLEIIDYDNDEKKKYITLEGKKEPLLVLNRGYGKGKYVFNYCLINSDSDSEKPYLIENHLICLINKNKKLKKEEVIKKYNELIKSFTDKKTKEFVSLFFGNNAVNTTELKYILPIYH